MNLLDSIHHPDKTIILSTHDVNLAYQWADEVVVMNDGKVIYHGDPVSVFHDEDVLLQAHLEKPWVFEMFQALLQSRNLAERDLFPRTKEELLQNLETEKIY